MMTDKSDSDKKNNEPEVKLTQKPDPKLPKRSQWKRRLSVWGGSLVLVSLGGGLAYGWFFIQRQLVPLVEKELTDFLNRPVKLGSLEGISLFGARLGASEILSTPTDPAKVSITAVDVTFDPFLLLAKRELQLNVTAIQPNIYLEQGKKRNWLVTQFDSTKREGSEGRFKVNVKTLQLQDAQIILAARSPAGKLQKPVKILIDTGKAEFIDAGKIIEFDLSGELANGGELEVSGVSIPKTEAINLIVRGNKLQASDVDNLLALPFDISMGTIGANLEVKLRPKQIPRVNGVASLQEVTAQISALTQPFTRSNGQLRFQGTEIRLENVTSVFGSIPGVANGTINLQKGYALTAKTQPIRIQQVIEALKLQKPSVPILGEIQADIRVSGWIDRPQLTLDVVTTKQTRVDRVDFRPGSRANLQLIDSNLFIDRFQAVPTVGGKLTGTGRVQFESQKSEVGNQKAQGKGQDSKYIFDLQATNVPAQAIARLYQTHLPVNPGLVSGQARFLGTLENPEKLQATGLANFRLGGGSVSARNFQFANRRWQGNVQTFGVSLASLNPALPPQLHQGRLTGAFAVAGMLDSFRPETIRATGSASIAIAQGVATANELTLANGRWTSDLKAQGIQVTELFPNVPSEFAGILNGTFNLAGRVEDLLKTVRGNGTANLALSKGAIAAENLQLADGKFKAAVIPDGVALKQFSKDGRGTLAGKLQVLGPIENPTLKDIQASGELKFSHGIGAIAQPLTTAISWNGRRLDIQQATAKGIQASGWADIATERLGTPSAIERFELQVAANRADLKAFSLFVPASLARFDYSGSLDFKGTIAGTLRSPKINGNLAIGNLQVAGLEFDRSLKGTVKELPEKGIELALAGREDEIQLALDPKYQPVSFDLTLDRMSVRGTRKNEWLQIEADNVRVGLFKNIATTSQFALPETLLAQPLSGELSGDFAFNLNTSELSGEQVKIANPRFGSLSGDRLTANFRYLDGNFILQNARLQKNDSQYLLNGSLTNAQRGSQWQAEVAVSGGKIQDVLETLQIFELSDLTRGLKAPDYDKAADLYEVGSRRCSDATATCAAESEVKFQGRSQNTEIQKSPVPNHPLFSVGTPETSILNQLSHISEIETLLRRQRKQRQEASPLPELAELKGTFDGNLVVSNAPNSGLKASFDFQGKGWQWRDFAFSQIDLKGGFHNGIVSLAPLKIQSGESLFAFSGSIGGKIPSGQLQLANVPIQLLSEFVDLPPTVTFGGLLNGDVKLGGSRDNPQATGELAIAKATINKTALSTTQGSFTYDNGRLNFQASSKLNHQAQPIILQGSIPYQMPFSTVKLDSDRLQLNLQVKNEGMALLDILSKDALSWIDGEGEIALDISGRFDRQLGRPSQLRAEGIATFNNATIGAQVIPEEPLTEVNGKILFNFDRLKVESLKGKFGGGEVAVAGTLPLVESTPQLNPLTVTLDNLALNLKGLYRGGVRGEVAIAGSVLEPEIGGKLRLFDGQVLLGEENATENGGKGNGGDNGEFGFKSMEFDRLQLTLADNIQIVRPPVLNFLASGSLTLNGNLSQPRPQGKITLKSGQVNLFASQFRLDKGADNSAQFSPKRGLDPYLNVQLLTSATETTRDPVLTNPSSTEIIDPFTASLDSLQTVRIRARIQGYASQLTNSLELTSTPPRTQREIIALLGGGFVNTLGRGDTTLGLTNLAGSAVSGTIQNAMSDRLGLSEFRIFSTPLIDEQERISRNQIGIAAEAGIDLTKDVSFSAMKILNTDRLPQFGLQYRINGNTVIRGSTNFSDDSRAIIEYEQRF
ncbi:MAG: translocation/assembly module TamB domain-containing protein [Hydrococcus sp. C42_A2020_068]|nr:translocation/assembly module TamB domain-containing protein [Hydrococcus sp. C42_A2020_068]